MMHHHNTHTSLYTELTSTNNINDSIINKRKAFVEDSNLNLKQVDECDDDDMIHPKKTKNGKVDLFKQFQEQAESQNPPRLVSFKRKVSSSRYKGVLYVKSQNKWRAQVCLGGKKKYIGSYDSEVEAAVSRDKKIKQLFGDRPELLNFPSTATTNSFDLASSFPHNFNVNSQMNMNLYPQISSTFGVGAFGSVGVTAQQLRRNTNVSYTNNYDDHPNTNLLVYHNSNKNEDIENSNSRSWHHNFTTGTDTYQSKWGAYTDPTSVYGGYPVADYE